MIDNKENDVSNHGSVVKMGIRYRKDDSAEGWPDQIIEAVEGTTEPGAYDQYDELPFELSEIGYYGSHTEIVFEDGARRVLELMWYYRKEIAELLTGAGK